MWTLALVSGVPGLTPRIVPVAEEVTVLRVGPALHLLLHAAPAPRCVLALRTARAALLAARPVPMVRVGAASASASPTRAVLDLAAQSLALASQRPDGFGPVLGCADPGG